MQAAHLRVHRAAHHEPHDDFRAFQAAERRELGVRHARYLLRIVLEQVHELAIPIGIVETRALAVHLVRQSAGGHERHLDVRGIAFDRAPQRLPEPVHAACGRNGKLQHADLQRHHRCGPASVVVRQHHRQGREDAMVQCAMLEDGQVELVGHQRRCDPRRELRIAARRLAAE